MLISRVQSLAFPPSVTYLDLTGNSTHWAGLPLPARGGEPSHMFILINFNLVTLLLTLLLIEAVLARYQVCPTLAAHLVRRNMGTRLAGGRGRSSALPASVPSSSSSSPVPQIPPLPLKPSWTFRNFVCKIHITL